MIQFIGLMIGAYIFTRMLDTATTASVHVVVRIVAVLTILVDALCVVGLISAGASMPAGLR